jgi:hypothetical protein
MLLGQWPLLASIPIRPKAPVLKQRNPDAALIAAYVESRDKSPVTRGPWLWPFTPRF